MVCNVNIFVFNANCVDAFRWLFDCSKGHFNTVNEGNCQVTSRSILYLKGKSRIDVKGEGGGGQLLTSI